MVFAKLRHKITVFFSNSLENKISEIYHKQFIIKYKIIINNTH